MANNLKPRCVSLTVTIQTEGYDIFDSRIDLSLHASDKETHEAASALWPVLFADAREKYRMACAEENAKTPPAEASAEPVAAALPPEEEVPF